MSETNGKAKWIFLLVGFLVAGWAATVGYAYGYIFPKITDSIVANDRIRASEDARIIEKLEAKIEQADVKNEKAHDSISTKLDTTARSLIRIEAAVLKNNKRF